MSDVYDSAIEIREELRAIAGEMKDTNALLRELIEELKELQRAVRAQ
jgi:hypothetical protein